MTLVRSRKLTTSSAPSTSLTRTPRSTGSSTKSCVRRESQPEVPRYSNDHVTVNVNMKQINNILNQNWDFALQNLLYIQYSTYNVGCSFLLVLYSVLILISILSIIFTIMILLIYFLGNVYACVHT